MAQRPRSADLALFVPVALACMLLAAACGGDDSTSSPATTAAPATSQVSATATPRPPETTATPVPTATPAPPVTADSMAADLAAMYTNVAVPPAFCSLEAMKAQWVKVIAARQAPGANNTVGGPNEPQPTWMNLIGSYAQELTKVAGATQNASVAAYLSAVRQFTQQEVKAAVASIGNPSTNPSAGVGGTTGSGKCDGWIRRRSRSPTNAT